jgi:hypothetical protein
MGAGARSGGKRTGRAMRPGRARGRVERRRQERERERGRGGEKERGRERLQNTRAQRS